MAFVKMRKFVRGFGMTVNGTTYVLRAYQPVPEGTPQVVIDGAKAAGMPFGAPQQAYEDVAIPGPKGPPAQEGRRTLDDMPRGRLRDRINAGRVFMTQQAATKARRAAEAAAKAKAPAKAPAGPKPGAAKTKFAGRKPAAKQPEAPQAAEAKAEAKGE